MPDVNQGHQIAPADGEIAVPLWLWDTKKEDPEVVSRLIITVTAKPTSGTAKLLHRGAASAPPAASTESETEQQSLAWRRKAQRRRLQANRPEGASGEAASVREYEPAFIPLRVSDWLPDFELSEGLSPWPLAPAAREPSNHRWTRLLTAGGALAGMLLATVTGMHLWHQNHLESERRRAEADANQLPAAVEQSTIRATVKMVPDARRTVELFFAAVTPEEKSAFVRGGAALLPAMRAYYASHPDESGKLYLASNVEFTTENGREFIMITGADANRVRVNAAVEVTPDGPRLDWRHLTGAGEIGWNQWIAQRPARAVRHRFMASLDDYYSGIFANPGTWICLKVTDASSSATVWAYAKRKSPDGSAILRNLAGRTAPVRLQGRFEFPGENPRYAPPGGRLAPQVLLDSLEASDWLDDEADAMGTVAVSGVRQDDLLREIR